MQYFQELEVWRRAFKLIRPVYVLTAAYPKEEKFGLVSQTRDCVIAVAANIAEGSRRRTPGEFRNSLSVAAGEDAELECLLMAGVELDFASDAQVGPLLAEVRVIARMLYAFDTTLARRYTKPRRNPRPPHSQAGPPKPSTRPPHD